MTVLVTGGSGFLGRHVVRALLDEGAAVRILDLKPLPRDCDIQDKSDVHIGSILDADAVEQAMAGVETVIHMAAYPGLWAREARLYERVNHQGTRAVLNAARERGAAFVYCSSPTTLAAKRLARLHRPLTEADRAEVLDLPPGYPRSKRRAELAVEAAAAEGMNALVVIPGVPLGPGDDSLTPPTRLFLDLAAGRLPALLDHTLPLTDARDFAEALAKAPAKAPVSARPVSEPRLILSGPPVRVFDLAAAIHRAGGARPPAFRAPKALALAAAYTGEALASLGGPEPAAPVAGVVAALRAAPLDAALAADRVGFSNRPLRDTVADTLDWARARGHLKA